MRVVLSTRLGHFTDDFDAMLDRRLIRVLVPYSRTFFFQDKGQIYGTAAETTRALEEWVNKTFKLGSRPLTVALIPTSRDRLFDGLLAAKATLPAAALRSPKSAKSWSRSPPRSCKASRKSS